MLIVLTVVNIVLIVYLFVLSLRIVLGWFAPQALGKAWDFLTMVTDPYLKLFARIRFLRGNMFDFSPVAALLVIVVALNLVNQLLYYGRITLGFFLAAVFSAAWSGIWFLLLFFLIVGLLRTIPLAFRATSGSGLWRAVDTIMQPIVAWVTRVLRLGGKTGYIQHLLLTIGLLLVAVLLGGFLVSRIVSLIQMIPF